MFRFFVQRDLFSQASRGVAKGALVVGLLLIGFGMLVFILRDLFAFLAAALFFMAGFSAIGYAIRMFWTTWRYRRSNQPYRYNVDIHSRDPFNR